MRDHTLLSNVFFMYAHAHKHICPNTNTNMHTHKLMGRDSVKINNIKHMAVNEQINTTELQSTKC